MSVKEEVKDCTVDELELILETQRELYSESEMKEIEEVLKEKEKEKAKKIIERLPKTIVCPKCDGPNRFDNDVCEFCGNELNKEIYYSDEYYSSSIEEYSDKTNSSKSYTFHYIISFLIPMVGFIVGGIMLSSDDNEKCSSGKRCILLGMFSIIFSAILSVVLWKVLI